ncbi:MAG TPA: hypothetical protein EYN69_14470 [Flavobacteriales bacterium]|nr:hypothetical protein [Flavobacteriales bacterium]
MAVIGSACLLLVVSCEWIGSATFSIFGYGNFSGLDIPIIFVSVILASAATSVPDTIISMRDAKRGNYDDAISNAIGSNIFDVCFALGLPLLIYTLMYGELTMSSEVVVFSSELRILLLILTFLTVLIYYVGKKMGPIKAYTLIGMYVLFVVYIVGRSQNWEYANSISEVLLNIYYTISH